MEKPMGAWHRHPKNPDDDVSRHNFVPPYAFLCYASVLATYARYTVSTSDDSAIEHHSTRRDVPDITR